MFNVSGRINADNPIFPLFTVGDLRPVKEMLQELKESIASAFFIDRLLDLNNDVRMTLGEAQIRNKLRGESLSTLFSRQETELFTPLIQRTFNILLRQGRFGSSETLGISPSSVFTTAEPLQIPPEVEQAILDGKNIYEIQYVSPAKRMMQAEELSGILTVFDFALQNAQLRPDLLDNINTDFAVKRVAELSGTTTEVLNSDEVIQGIREQRAEQQQLMAQQELARNQSEIARNQAQAQATLVGANQNLAGAV